MNEWFKKLFAQIKNIWGKWTLVQKIIFFSIIAVVIIAIVVLVNYSSTPNMVTLIGRPISDSNQLNQIINVLDEEIPGEYRVSPDNIVMVKDQKTAKHIRTILIREDLMPAEVDPWEIFDTERWTLTDFERKVNLRRAIQKSIEDHILSLDEVDGVSVIIDIPEDSFFPEDQKPYTASIQITPKPGSDITENRKKIEGIEKLVTFALSGLQHEYIVITDHWGNVLNDFEGLEEIDRLNLVKRQIEQKDKLERKYRTEIYNGLARIFGKDRVAVVKLEIDLDMSKEASSEKRYLPFEVKPDNPNTPFDDSDVRESTPISRETVNETFRGTNPNPEGPPGYEGQTPPEYKDMSNMHGEYEKESEIVNMAIGEKSTEREERPWDIARITAGIAIDGLWEIVYDEEGNVVFEENNNFKVKRNYLPLGEEERSKALKIVQDAVGYNRARGDSVSVEHLQFNRIEQFAAEDDIYRREKQLADTLFWILIGIGAIVAASILFRIVSKYLERKKREKEEELARQHQAMREAALRSAEEQGVDVELSVEERARMEMQENAINMAREHPEDVAQLIRTWLLEE